MKKALIVLALMVLGLPTAIVAQAYPRAGPEKVEPVPTQETQDQVEESLKPEAGIETEEDDLDDVECFIVEKVVNGVILPADIQRILFYELTFELPHPGRVIGCHIVSYSDQQDYFWSQWMEIDGHPLGFPSFVGIHPIELEAGEHTFSWFGRNELGRCGLHYRIIVAQTIIRLVISYQPSIPEQLLDHSQPVQESIISQSFSVTVPGCVGVYDEIGNKMNCRIVGDKVILDDLPAGTYYLHTQGFEWLDYDWSKSTQVIKMH